jgi:ubiquinone/menaquinone biosynthesis C-methylase UbiE
MYKRLLNSDNFIDFLEKNTDLNRLKQIQMGYDLQCGSYERNFNFNDLMKKRVKILKEKICENLKYKNTCNIIEIGIGEGNTMRHLKDNLEDSILDKINFYGIELSFCRIKITKKHLPECKLILADMNNLPFEDDSFDIVYTASSIEPNFNNEKKILNELYRICKNDLILFEISYRDANEYIKKRFDDLKYINRLYETILDENYNLVSYRELVTSKTYNNYLYLIKKKSYSNIAKEINYISPIFNDELEIVLYNNAYYYKSKKLNLYFPIIDNIAILLINNSLCIVD